MSIQSRSLLHSVLFGFIAAITIGHPALADDHTRQARIPMSPKYQQECAACHIAYPPGMLPASSWQRVMSTLPRHYGSDASLDPVSLKEIGNWLDTYAGTMKRVSEAPPENRITRSTWFIRKHDEVSAATWKLPAVKSASSCMACHTGANQGDFNEHNVRIPR